MGPHAVLIEDLDADPADWAAGLRRLSLAGRRRGGSGGGDRARRLRRRGVRWRRCASGSPRCAPSIRHGRFRRGADRGRSSVRRRGSRVRGATAVGLDVDEVVALHSAAEYVVAFCGFAPGFGYLRGLDPRLHLPRRATPRTRVPAGSVAIAAEYTAVYPRPVARRLAPARQHRPRDVRPRPLAAGAVRARRRMSGSWPHELGDRGRRSRHRQHDPGPWPSRVRPSRRVAVGCRRPAPRIADEPARRQSRLGCRDRDVRWSRAALHRGGVDRDLVGVGTGLDRRRRHVPRPR